MNSRIERILIKLAQQNASHLTHLLEGKNADSITQVQLLARQLARYNVLVLMGYLGTGMVEAREVQIQNWVNEYGLLYHLLTRALFPSLDTISAQYADEKTPSIVVIRGDATPVLNVLAGFIVPYVASRQAQPYISEAELLGLLNIILDELEASDLPRPRYEALRNDSVTIIKRLLTSPVRQIGLTEFDRPVFGKTQPLTMPPENLPEQSRPPAPPAAPLPEAAPAKPETPPKPDPKYELPRLEEDDAPTPTEQLFRHSIPMDTGRFKRRPPVPDLPDEE